MIDQVADAFKGKDYRTAAALLKQLVKEQPQNPWVHFYIGRLKEEGGRLEEADRIYRQLLKGTTNPKIVSQARQGLKRLEDNAKQQRQQQLAAAKADAGSAEQGLLVLEAISSELKQDAAQKFARILQIDPYTARINLPSRGWRLYQVGSVGELKYYSQQLQEAEIPCFVAALSELEKINVLAVSYFQSVESQTVVVCQNAPNQVESFSFNWSEVKQRVLGLLPIFEEVVELDRNNKTQRKTQILDYVQFCDLHLPARGSILRLCDRNYQFQQGMALDKKQEVVQPLSQTTTRKSWDNLSSFLDGQLPEISTWSDFTTFAETTLDRTEFLKRLKSHIDLFRRKETLWDPAFHLYSGLVFLREAQR